MFTVESEREMTLHAHYATKTSNHLHDCPRIEEGIYLMTKIIDGCWGYFNWAAREDILAEYV